MDVLSPAGVAKLLMKDPGKPTIRDVKEGKRQDENGTLPPADSISNLWICGYSAAPSDISCGSSSLQDRRMKEAVLRRKIREKMREEHENHIRWSVTSTTIHNSRFNAVFIILGDQAY